MDTASWLELFLWEKTDSRCCLTCRQADHCPHQGHLTPRGHGHAQVTHSGQVGPGEWGSRGE